MIGMAEELGYEVSWAEGCGTVRPGPFLKDLGCDQVQGYAGLPPLTVDHFEQWLDTERE